MSIIVGNASHTGMVRTVNEDYFGYYKIDDIALLVIADGMGGHQGGKVASKIAVDSIREYFESQLRNRAVVESLIDESLNTANRMIRDYASADMGLYGMGATVILLVIRDRTAYFRHLGDCRLYLIRNNEIRRMTKDHTLVQRLLDDGIITKAESLFHPERNIVTKALGGRFYLEFDEPVATLLLEEGDRLLMCSDGLFDLMSDEEIGEIAKRGEPQSSAEALVSEANRRGGNDNITVQVVLYTGD